MMSNPEALIIVFVVVVVAVVGGLGGIWNNWIWIGKDGYNLLYHLRPGFFRFWFSVIPRKIFGFKTGMEDIVA
jgi:hypothetical protein